MLLLREVFFWIQPVGESQIADPARLFYVRINTLARTDRPDSRYQAPVLNLIEDKSYSGAQFNQYNTRLERMFRRRTLRTTVDLRNL